jgi:hypothetical protein
MNKQITTQSTLSMKAKTKRKPISLLNAKQKNDFSNYEKMRKTKHLTLNQSLVLNQSNTLSS